MKLWQRVILKRVFIMGGVDHIMNIDLDVLCTCCSISVVLLLIETNTAYLKSCVWSQTYISIQLNFWCKYKTVILFGIPSHWPYVGWDSIVSIATHCGLDGPGFKLQWSEIFHSSWQVLGAQPSSYTLSARSFLVINQPGHGVIYPPIPSVEVKKE